MQKPTVADADLIIMEANAYDLEVMEDYSGRGMYGDTCVAITGDGSTNKLFVAIGRLIEQGQLPEDAERWFNRSDSMGLGWVVY